MSFNEIVLAAGGLAIGLGSGSIISYLYVNRAKNSKQRPESGSEKKTDTETNLGAAPSVGPSSQSSRLIPTGLLEKSKRELRTLLLEKELVSAALTRLYEALSKKEITKEELDTLGTRYREEMKSLDEKILKIDALIEVGDLETLRDQLVRLVNQKMDVIDRRIEKTKITAGPLVALINPPPKEEEPKFQEPAPPKPRVPDISDMLGSEVASEPVTPVAKSDLEPLVVQTELTAPEQVDLRMRRRPVEPDAQAEQLQKELLEALDRLEKLDVETS